MEYYLIILWIMMYIITIIIFKNWLNVFLFITFPYVFIIIFNNMYMSPFEGFFLISSRVVYKILILIFIIFIGMLFGEYIFMLSHSQNVYKNNIILSNSKYIDVFIFILSINLLRFFIIMWFYFTNSLETLASSDFDLINNIPILGHLTIISNVSLPILIDNWINHKKQSYLVLSIFAILLNFATFVKYQVIIVLLYLIIYYSYAFKLKVKHLVGFIVMVIFVFYLNYYLIFYYKSANIMSFVLYKHLWAYIAGGVIVLNNLEVIVFDYNLYDLIISSFNPLFNYILFHLDFKLIKPDNIIFELSNFPLVSNYGQRTNVLSFLGHISILNNMIISFIAVFILGVFLSILDNCIKKTNKLHLKILCVSIIAYFSLSFFSNYWALSSTWFWVIYSIILPFYYENHNKIV